MAYASTIPSHTRRLGWRTALLALVALCLFAGNVAAAGAIQDDGNMFSQSAQTDFANRSAQIERDTGKSVVVRTVASLGGKDISAQADAAFAQLNVNGVLIYLAKNEKKSSIKVGATTRQAISLQEEGQIRDGLDASFARGDFDSGLLNTTDRIGRDFRAVFTGTTANRGGTANQPAPTTTSGAPRQNNGVGLGAILGILFLVGAIIVVARLITRRGSGGGGNVYTGNNYGSGGGSNYAPGPPPGPGYGGVNYGGYGQQPPATGGGFGSSVAGGAVGGFGGAILGNAVYDHFRDGERGQNGNYNNNGPNGGGAYPGNNAPNQDPNNDHGRVDDSYQDTGSWGGGDNSGASSAESSAGTGSWGDSGGGSDSGSSGDSGGGSDSGGGGDFSA